MSDSRKSSRSTELVKVPATGDYKILQVLPDENQKHSLVTWGNIYFQVHVMGSPYNTQNAKRNDLDRFLNFYQGNFGHDQVDSWTPTVTKAFQRHMQTAPRKAGEKKNSGVGEGENKPLAATTINRVMATLRHFAKFLHGQRPLLAGNPFAGLKDIAVEEPAWNGLSDRDRLRLKSACEQRMKLATRKDQDPLMEAAVFHCLLWTGLRRSELASLNIGQYHHRGFHDVGRKGNKVTRKVPVPGEAREWLDRYLAQRSERAGGLKSKEPLFISRTGERISTKAIWLLCKRIAAQASVNLPEGKQVDLAPHKLRHTFLKGAADKYGIHIAQDMSGNISMKEVFRYTKPSQEEKDQLAEGVF